MTTRRQLIMTLLAALAAPAAFAAPAISPVYVVKFISFSCNFCRSAEQGDVLVKQAVESTGGTLSVAPVDTTEDPTFIRERMYYAARSQGDAVATAMRQAMYVATQDHGLTFSSLSSLDTWLAVNGADWLQDDVRKTLVQAAAAADTEAAIGRAIRLAKSAGVDTLPAYVVIQDGNVKAVFDRQGYPSLHDLRDKLNRRILEMVAIPKS